MTGLQIMVGDKGCQTLAICQSKDHFPGGGVVGKRGMRRDLTQSRTENFAAAENFRNFGRIRERAPFAVCSLLVVDLCCMVLHSCTVG